MTTHALPPDMRRVLKRERIEKLAAANAAHNRLTPEFLAQLERCKDDAARHLLLHGIGDYRGTGKSRKDHHPYTYTSRPPLAQLDQCKNEAARKVIRGAYKRRR